MIFEQYDIFKIFDEKNNQFVFVSLLREKRDGFIKAKVLRPSEFPHKNILYTDKVFKQFCHEDDYIDYINANFNPKDLILDIHPNMCQEASKEELIDLFRYFITRQFNYSDKNTSIMAFAFEKILEKLGFNSDS